MKPAFLITIDTEGDNLWGAPATITTENSKFIPRFQSLCVKYGFKPTYLTDYHMLQCPVFSKLGRDWMRNGTAEIGAHMHAWNTPPLKPITENDDAYGPYATEYSADLVLEKFANITRLLENTFDTKIAIARVGGASMVTMPGLSWTTAISSIAPSLRVFRGAAAKVIRLATAALISPMHQPNHISSTCRMYAKQAIHRYLNCRLRSCRRLRKPWNDSGHACGGKTHCAAC